MTNEKKSNMSDEQKLYPQLIYRINSILSDIKSDLEKDYKEGELFIAPSVLDPHTRTFNWLMVNDEKWKFLNTKEKDYIEHHIKDCWEKFEKEFIRRKEMETVSDAIDIIKNSADEEEYHFALLSIYQFYPNNPKKYIDGIIYRNIARRAKERNGKNHRIDYAQVTLQCGNENKNTYILYPWVEIDFFDNKGIPERKYSCQEFNPSDPKKGIAKGYPADDNPDVDKPEEIKPLESELDYKKYGWGKFTPATLRTNHFHKNYFVPFFVKDEGFNPKEFYKLSPEYLSQRKYIYIKPLYDALYGEYGNLCAVLQIPFVNTTERDKFNEVKNILINRLPFLVNEIKNAAFFEILKQPIEGDDLLEHFTKYLPMLQDWERIMLWEIKKGEGSEIKDAILQYCYKRENEDKWNKCEPENINTKCKNCKTSDSKSYFDDLKNWIIKGGNEHLSSDEADFPIKNSKRKAFLEKILTQRFIPELYEEDEVRYENFRLIYEYPPYTIFPEDESRSHTLGLFYERQQIDLLRQLAIKRKVIRETIKHGTRAAVAAIMGRNMSHNIGSHVLSYLSEKDGYGFLRYLQGRADFLAEISTTKPKWTAQRKLISDIISPFVYSDIKSKRGELLDNIGRSVYIDKNYLDASRIKIIVLLNKFKIKFDYNCREGKFEDPIINDCEGKNASAAFEDLPVEIPHGIMGSHALYSILENFIRNSVKHNAEEIKNKLRDNNFKLEIYIKVIDVYKNEGAKQNKQFEGLIKIRLYDNISKYTNEAKEGIEKHIDVKKNGKLVKDDGSLEGGGGWGIKEMRLSAAWLRSVPPENIQFKDEDPPVIRLDMEKSYICYEFFLLKPLDVLIINNYKTLKEDHQKGIYIANSLEKVEYLLDSGKLRHRFVVFNISDIENGLNDNQLLRLPARIFVVTDEKVSFCEKKIVYISLDEYKKIISDKKYIVIRLYKKWIEYLYGSIIPKILVKGDSQVKDTINSLEKHCLPAIDNEKQIIFEHPANNLNIDNQIYWEPFSTGAGKGTLSGKLKILRDSNDKITKLKTLYEIYEAVLINIVIVDERLFTKVDRETTFMNVGATKRELLEKWKIDVINLSKVNGELIVYSKGSSNAWNEYINNKNITFLSIHQTIIKDIGEDLFHSKIVSSKEIRHVIIHSGRGPVDITPGFKFLEFSNIENLIIDTPDKHLLTDLFMGIKGGVE